MMTVLKWLDDDSILPSIPAAMYAIWILEVVQYMVGHGLGSM